MPIRSALLTLALPALVARAQGPVPAKTEASAWRFPEVQGWQRAEPIKRFAPENLYEFINGASESFLAFAFQELRVAEYTGAEKASVMVEAYRHPSPLLAFGIYSQEKPSRGSFAKFGAQGYLAPPILNFYIGDTYFKLSAYGLGEASAGTLERFARKLEEACPGDRSLPAALALFPPQGKVPNSERYQLENVMGYEFLRSAFTADYEIAGQSFQLLLFEGDVDALITKYCQTVKQPRPDAKAGRCTLQDPNQGALALAWSGKYLGVVLHLPDTRLREQYLSKVIKSLH